MGKKSQQRVPISFFDLVTIRDKLKRAAHKKGVTLSALIRMLVREFLEKSSK